MAITVSVCRTVCERTIEGDEGDLGGRSEEAEIGDGGFVRGDYVLRLERSQIPYSDGVVA